MRVIGVNKGTTLNGKELRYGGAAIVNEGQVVAALLEERITRIKRAGGYDRSLKEILYCSGELVGRKEPLNLADFDCVAVSTCCESEEAAAFGHSLEGKLNLVTVGHHMSHASLAYFCSPFDPALIVVIDGGGNTLTGGRAPDKWWEYSREQHSYYLAHDNRIELIGRDFDNPFDTGLGELYRAFSYFLGFNSSMFASKVMALAAYGNPDNISKHKLVTFDDGKLKIPVANAPKTPVEMIRSLLHELGVPPCDPRKPAEEILQIHRDLAAYLQIGVQAAILDKIQWLISHYKVADVCFSGGFALNCVVNGILARTLNGRLYVPYAPGDEGQAIGNAIAASVEFMAPHYRSLATETSHARLGPDHRMNSERIVGSLRANQITDSLVFEPRNLPKTIAGFLEASSAVAVHFGRSEAGVRALGNRSILGDPRKEFVKAIFNQIKGREWFQPFAPTVLADCESDYFEGSLESPFMSIAVPVKQTKRSSVPAITHIDGSARVQTLKEAKGSLMSDLIKEFQEIAGIPLVLNTSFNLGGEPIVETPEDAVSTFSRMPVNALAVDRFLVVKEIVPILFNLGLLPTLPLAMVRVVSGGQVHIPPSTLRTDGLLRWIQSSTKQVVFIRSTFPLYGEYLDWLNEGRKVTTIRFRKGAIEYPGDYMLPLFATKDYTLARAPGRTTVQIEGIKYSLFGDLTAEDAHRDGFRDHNEMVSALTTIYPKLKANDWVTVYTISPQ